MLAAFQQFATRCIALAFHARSAHLLLTFRKPRLFIIGTDPLLWVWMSLMDGRQALQVWFDVVAGSVLAEGPDLSARQLAVLMSIYMKPAPHTVRGLAADLDLGKPAVTRALDALSELGLLKRVRDPEDGRNVLIQRTVRGSVFLSEMGDHIVEATQRVQTGATRHAA